MNEITTTNLAEFGARERIKARKLLEAWENQGLPKDFNDDAVTIMMNKNSGNVFLTNSDYQVAMLTDDDGLESFYSCPICGEEGFFDEVKGHQSDNKECREWVRDIKRGRK